MNLNLNSHLLPVSAAVLDRTGLQEEKDKSTGNYKMSHLLQKTPWKQYKGAMSPSKNGFR